MPTYVYTCDACNQQFEQVQSFKDDPIRVCICGQEGQVRRVFQPVGIVFKGSGWYITDSRKSETASVNPAANTTSDATAKADSTTPAPTETKSSSESTTTTPTTSTPTTTAAPSAD
jgi:putative FmdB family regulatory protein